MDLFNQINVLNLLQEERILVQHGLKLLSTELDISELLYPAIKQPLDLIGTYGADRLQRLLIAVYGDAPLMPTLRIDFFEDIDLTTFIIIGCCVSIKKFLRLSLDSLVALKKLALELATKLQSSIVTDARIRAIIDKGPNCFKRRKCNNLQHNVFADCCDRVLCAPTDTSYLFKNISRVGVDFL